MSIAYAGDIAQAQIAESFHTEVVLTVPAGGVGGGSSVLIALQVLGIAGAVSVTDSRGNDYTVDLDAAGPSRVLILSAHGITALAAGDEITIAIPGAFFSAAAAFEYAGLDRPSPQDRVTSASGAGLEVGTGPTPPTQQAVELAFAVFGTDGPGEELTPGAGWTLRAAASSYVFEAGGGTVYPVDRVLSAVGAASATGELSAPRAYCAGLVTYRGREMGEPVSWRGFAGIALESNPGNPVKSLYKLDLKSETLRGTGEPLPQETITENRMVEKVVMGPYDEAGDLVYHVTPDITTTLLYAVLTGLNTTGAGDPYVHVFKTGTSLKAITAQVARGDFFFVYPGLYVSRLTFRPNAEEVLEATASFGGRAKERIFDAAQSDAGVIYSSADPFVFHEATVELHGGGTAESMNWEIAIETGLLRNRGLGSGRAHNRAFAGRSRVSGSFDLIFDTIEAHRRWMGASSSGFPIQVGNSVQFFAANVLYTQSATRKIKFEFPKMYYRASGPEHKSAEGIVVQRCEFGTKKDLASGSDIVVTVTNGEANGAIVTAGVEI